MGKTPAQEARAAAKKAGMSHDKVKKDAAAESHKLKMMANKDLSFGKAKGAGQNTKAELAKQRARDLLDPTTEIGRAKLKEDKKKAREELDFLLHKKGITVKQRELKEGEDSKEVLCEFFRYNACAKGANCKFSHDLAIERKLAERQRNLQFEKQEEKRSIYEDDPDSMHSWDQTKLEDVINQKHGAEATQQNETQIVCKYFLEAVEGKTYGWFWKCPDDPDCKYKHKLPKGYVLKSEMRELMIAEKTKNAQKDQLFETLEKLAGLQFAGGSSRVELTDESYSKWREGVLAKKAEARTKAADARKKKGLLTGREIMEQGLGGMDTDDDCAMDMGEFFQELKARREAEVAKAEKQAAENLSTAQANKDVPMEDVGNQLYVEEDAAPPVAEAAAEAAAPEPAAPAAEREPGEPTEEEWAAMGTAARKKLKKKLEQDKLKREAAAKEAERAAAKAAEDAANNTPEALAKAKAEQEAKEAAEAAAAKEAEEKAAAKAAADAEKERIRLEKKAEAARQAAELKKKLAEEAAAALAEAGL